MRPGTIKSSLSFGQKFRDMANFSKLYQKSQKMTMKYSNFLNFQIFNLILIELDHNVLIIKFIRPPSRWCSIATFLLGLMFFLIHIELVSRNATVLTALLLPFSFSYCFNYRLLFSSMGTG